MFATRGDLVRLEEVAKVAGVGVATLYRNFASREALVEEVYRAELGRLCAGTDRLLATREPVEALRTWMRCYQAFVTNQAWDGRGATRRHRQWGDHVRPDPSTAQRRHQRDACGWSR